MPVTTGILLYENSLLAYRWNYSRKVWTTLPTLTQRDFSNHSVNCYIFKTLGIFPIKIKTKQRPPTCKIKTLRSTRMCSFRSWGSYLVHLDCNKLTVPLPKGPPCSHTKNLAQKNMPMLTENFMCRWGKANSSES